VAVVEEVHRLCSVLLRSEAQEKHSG
jgi:hypothetical protein